MTNQIGIISMQYNRPFALNDMAQLTRWKKAGFDFVEFLVPEPAEINRGALRQALADAGLAVVLTARVNLARDIVSENPSNRKGGLDYLYYCLEVAQELGARTLGGPLYGSPLVFAGKPPQPISESARKARVEWCINALKILGSAAEKAGICLAVEPLNRFETDFVNTTRQAVELVRCVDIPAVGLTLDTFHMNIEDDDIAESIRLAAPYIKHFQANENHRGYLGTGHVEWTSVIRALGEAGYAGTITLEPFRRTDERLSIPFAQWKPPLHDEQAELAASCAFIRNLIALNGGRT